MATILKIVAYKCTMLTEAVLRVTSSSNTNGDDMTLDELKNYLQIRMSEFPSVYKESRLDILDDKLFYMEDGKMVTFIIEHTKL